MLIQFIKQIWQDCRRPSNVTASLQSAAKVISPDLIERLSHEMRTSLTGIVGYAEFIEEGAEPAMTSFTAKIIRESSQELVRSVQSFVDLYQTTLSSAKLNCSEFSAARVMYELVGHYQARALELNLSLILNCSDETQLASLYSDQVHFTKLMDVLISSALNGASNGAMVVVAMRLHAKSQSIEILIHELGGKAKLRQSDLFKKFWSASGYVYKMQEGPGLDLALAKSLLNGLGGYATFKAVKDQGDQL